MLLIHILTTRKLSQTQPQKITISYLVKVMEKAVSTCCDYIVFRNFSLISVSLKVRAFHVTALISEEVCGCYFSTSTYRRVFCERQNSNTV